VASNSHKNRREPWRFLLVETELVVESERPLAGPLDRSSIMNALKDNQQMFFSWPRERSAPPTIYKPANRRNMLRLCQPICNPRHRSSAAA